MRCPVCDVPLPAGARFCPACGAPVASIAPDQAEQRRLLTVLFADLVGFTTASDGADPEDVRRLVRPFHALVRREAARTGGTVARVVGDGVMAVWGFPVAREDDARRALAAAVQIRDGTRSLPGGLHVRIGVNSGEAVVTFGASDERADDAMGDAVNLASRLASAAPVDGILAGELTAFLAGDALEVEPIEPLAVRGKAAPVAASLVRQLRVGLRRSGGGSLVGRGPDLARLVEAIGPALGGSRTRRILVTGEPGIGKSRLVDELRASTPGVRWLVGHCRDGGRAPGQAFGELVKAAAGIAEIDTQEAAAVRLDDLLAATVDTAGERAWLRERLVPLVGATLADGAPRPVDEGEREEAWARFLAALAGSRPLVVLLEDIHWADEDTASFLTSGALAGLSAPVAVVMTARPEAVSAWPRLRALERVDLMPLDEPAALEMLATLDGQGQVDDAVARALVRRAGGNPLFLGELVRYRAQTAGGGAAGSMPETLRAVIGARLDLLSPEARAVAQDAAVIGEAFWRDALVAMGGGAEAEARVDRALQALEAHQLARATATTTMTGDVEFVFSHALVRDTAYGQLTRLDRARRHVAVADWLESGPRGDRPDLAGLVADHLAIALELSEHAATTRSVAPPASRVMELQIRAGRHALALDPGAAVERLHAALALASDVTDRLRIIVQLARALLANGAHREAIAIAEEGVGLARGLADARSEGFLEVILGRAARPMGDAAWSSHAPRAVELLEPLGPSPELVDAYLLATYVQFTSGTGAALEHVAALAITTAERIGDEPPPEALSRRAFSRASVADPSSYSDIERAISISRAGGDSLGLATALSDLGGIHMYFARPSDAATAFAESLEVARSRSLGGMVTEELLNIGYVQRIRGDIAGALRTLREAETLAASAPRPAHEVAARWEQFLARLAAGDPEARWLGSGLMGDAARHPWGHHLRAEVGCLTAALDGDAAAFQAMFPGIDVPADPDDLDVHGALTYPALARGAIRLGAPWAIERLLGAVTAACPAGRVIQQALQAFHAVATLDDEALPRLRVAVTGWEEMGAPLEEAETRLVLARALAVSGAPREAAAEAGLARSLFDAAGAVGRSLAIAREAAGSRASLG